MSFELARLRFGIYLSPSRRVAPRRPAFDIRNKETKCENWGNFSDD